MITYSDNLQFYKSFQAYFTDGIFPSKANLLELASEMNLDVEAANQALSDQALFEEIYKKDKEWKKKGVSGRIINDFVTISSNLTFIQISHN
jgi:predicted DsbA family dithiol-disulfide isomerase